MKVLLTVPVTDEQFQRICEAAGDAVVVRGGTPQIDEREIADAEVVFGRFNRRLFERAQRLRWVQTLGAGVDGLLFPEFVESDIMLTSEKGHVGPHLAEQAFANLLALTRGVARAIRERTWENKWQIRQAAWELTGMTMGIVGLGGTGIEVARRAHAFGMRVLAVDPEPVVPPPFVEAVWRMDRFYDLLAQSDVVTICAPLTPQTRGMFNLEAFRHMRRHAILVNVTRGQIVDGPSLVQALQEGLIGGAALDVTPEEPLPPDHPLWAMYNVVITPHVAGASPLRADRAVNLFCDNLRRYRAGEPLQAIIDKRKGY